MINNNRFEVLDSFRGLCAVFVVIFHMNILNGISNYTFFKQSSLFVEFFFVLSGFVLTHTYAFKKTIDFKKFVTSRFFRLYPLHFFMLLVMILIEVGKLFAEQKGIHFQTDSFTATKALKEIMPNALLLQAWTPYTENASFNGPSWSISIEFYTYIIFYATLFAGIKLRNVLWTLISCVMFFLIFSGNSILLTTISRGLSCFFAGALTYLVYMQLRDFLLTRPSMIVFSVLEAMCLGMVYTFVVSEYEHKSILASLSFCLTIFIFSFEIGALSKLLRLTFFKRLGALSFSIYMTHAAILLVITAAFIVFQKVSGIPLTVVADDTRFLTLGSVLLDNILILLILASVFLVSIFTYKYIEVPFQKLGKAKRKQEALVLTN